MSPLQRIHSAAWASFAIVVLVFARQVPHAQAQTAAEAMAQAQTATNNYEVTEVAADDVLNVRAMPAPDAPILGTLAHNAQSVALTGRRQMLGEAIWVEITHAETTGWVNSHYLAEMENTSSIVAPSAPDAEGPQDPLNCSGTEPFWALDVKSMRGTLDSLSDGRADLEFEAVRSAQGIPVIWSYRGKDIQTGKSAFAILEETNECSDGMSDLAYKYSIRLDIENGPFFAGCCNRLPGQPDP